MENKPIVIGLSAYARSGKDTFCNLLKKSFPDRNVERFALADALKSDMHDFFLKKCQIDILKCTPEEKELIRPMLVEYGRLKRKQSKGRYWTRILENNIYHQCPDIAIVTDVRYAVYSYDELEWLKLGMNGILVHIKRYDTTGGMKRYYPAPNKDEEENDPKIQASADYRVEWESVPENELDKLMPHVEKFKVWLESRRNVYASR